MRGGMRCDAGPRNRGGGAAQCRVQWAPIVRLGAAQRSAAAARLRDAEAGEGGGGVVRERDKDRAARGAGGGVSRR